MICCRSTFLTWLNILDDHDQAIDDLPNQDNESVDENVRNCGIVHHSMVAYILPSFFCCQPVKRRRICAAEATESMQNYSQSVLSGNGAKNNKGGVKPKPVPQKVFDAYQQGTCVYPYTVS